MRAGLPRVFSVSAGTLLLATAAAKLVSAGGHARILQVTDPILAISFRHVFWIVGLLELMIALVCLFGHQPGLQAGLVAWLATSFVIYRLALYWSAYPKPCHCLGNLTDALQLSPQLVDAVMKIILAYLLAGSYAVLFWCWKQGNSRPD